MVSVSRISTVTPAIRTSSTPSVLRAIFIFLLVIATAWAALSARLFFVLRDTPPTIVARTEGNAPPDDPRHDGAGTVVALRLGLDPPLVVRMRLFDDAAPDAARYVRELVDRDNFGRCSLYRGEPVPPYWGSPDRPDRWTDGGRWGPPYALVQGGLIAPSGSGGGDEAWAIANAAPEKNNPLIERGHVAWAGGKGGPHFFVALASHPEWGHDHTVWAKVFEEDMAIVDSLLARPLKIIDKNVPVLSYFVDPITFTMEKFGTG